MFGFDDRTRALLRAVGRLGSISAAARELALDPANARRHLRTAEARSGARLVAARRGGRGGRNARLTPAGRRLAWPPSGSRALVGLVGEFDPTRGVTPVRVGRRALLAAGRHAPGPCELVVPPESVGLERAPRDRPARGHRSPRNVIPMRVDRIWAEGNGVLRVRLAAGALALEALIVRGAQRELRLRAGSRVDAIVKATAIQLAPIAAGEQKEDGSPTHAP